MKNKGITLVALVVTIVVLLILAGITITYVFGENSIFNQASEAKLKTDIANWQEKLEMAKSPVIIEGLGTLHPDKYFEYIQGQGIINNKNTDVIDNEDGSYDVTTKPGYVFLITLKPDEKNPTDAEIEYLGKTGSLQPKIKRINIVEATKSSFKIKVSARPEGGEVLCYYKAKASVAENEADNDITDYTEITLNDNLEGDVTSNLTAGTTYKVKAVLKKDEKDIGWVSKEVTTTILVTNITLNKTTAEIEEGKSETLIATVKPDNAENKEIEWKAEPVTIATVDQTGKVTGVVAGTATITATAKDGSEESASCTVTVKEAEAKWDEIAKWAEYIATHESEVSGTGTSKTANRFAEDTSPLKVGQTFKVYYGKKLIEVEIIDFLHDDLADDVRYASDTSKTKAGITFDFKNLIGTGKMNTTSTNSGGWASSYMRKTVIPSIRNNLSKNLTNVIKTVKKGTYKYEAPGGLDNTGDELWLLSECEVIGTRQNSLGLEGTQYPYYTTDAHRRKTNSEGQMQAWWLRSPIRFAPVGFCKSYSGGSVSVNENPATESNWIDLGFCI